MTFLSPWALLLLLVPIALAVGYVFTQKRRVESAARFSSVDLLASVAPKRSGWQRFLPWGALLAALVVGALAVAQPAWAVRVPKDRATIMLTLDTSASMAADDVSPTRFAAAQQAARDFTAGLPEGLQVGLVTFDRNAKLLLPPTTDRAALLSAIDSMKLGPGTATASGIELSLEAIDGVPAGEDGTRAPAAVVLMSDGTPTVGVGGESAEQSVAAAASRAKEAGVPITTIAFGTPDGVVRVQGEEVPVPFDPDAMAAIAEATGGRTFAAESAGELASAYGEIAGTVGYDVQTKEITVLFTAIAFLLGALAAVFALRWGPTLA